MWQFIELNVMNSDSFAVRVRNETLTLINGKKKRM